MAEQDTLLLTKIGFTPAQAQLFLTMHKTGESEARIIAKNANFPRQEVYRVLNELQEKGLIEKIVSTPQAYRPLPLEDALAIVVNTKEEEYKLVLEKTKEALARFGGQRKIEPPGLDYSISLLEGKKAIFLKSLKAHSAVTRCVDCCTTCERWNQVGYELFGTIKTALDKGVKYRTVLDKNGPIYFSKHMSALMVNKNFKVRLSRRVLKTNVAIFDNKDASLNFYPSKGVCESPMLWTNHPSLLASFQIHFEKDWASAEQINSRSKIRVASL